MMMTFIFTGMLVTFLLGWFRYDRFSIVLFLLTFLLAIALFLFEIYNNQTGFRMEWLNP